MSDLDKQNPPQSQRLVDMVAAAETPQEKLRLGEDTWLKIAILSSLFLVMHLAQIRQLLPTWLNDSNWQHGLIIPLFSLYLLYARRHELLTAGRKSCRWGLPIMALGIFFEVVGVYPLGITFLCNIGMIVLLFGTVLYVCGTRIIRITWLPIWFLIFAMPLPPMLYNNIAFPLQNLAATGSVLILQAFGVQISATASHLDVISRSGEMYVGNRGLTVAEACSGIRSLMAFLALGVAITYLEDRPIWQRITLVLLIVPVAIFCNVLRVAITCSMFVFDRPELGRDFMHEFLGMWMLIPAFLILWLLSYLLKKIGKIELYIEEEDDQAVTDQSSGKAGSA